MKEARLSGKSIVYSLTRRRELCTMRHVRGQTLGKVYCILANKEKRAVYDGTGKRPDSRESLLYTFQQGEESCVQWDMKEARLSGKSIVYSPTRRRELCTMRHVRGQTLGKVYCILSNKEKRAVYEEAGKRPDSRESLLYTLQQGEESCIRRGR